MGLTAGDEPVIFKMNSVQFGGGIMNKVVTSKEEILAASRELVLEKGIMSLSMRSVAEACGVAVGSIYNYFPSKAELLSAAVGSVWGEIFMPFYGREAFGSFLECVSALFETIRAGNEKYPGFFTVHALNFASPDKEKGKEAMNRCLAELEGRLAEALRQDGQVRAGVFGDVFTEEVFAGYVFELMLSIFLRKEESCAALLEMIRQTIYHCTPC